MNVLNESGLTIDHLLPGGPAAACTDINRGDILIMVDGYEVNLENFEELLRGR
jgi:C-terminal processing protease CtpA/Prc